MKKIKLLIMACALLGVSQAWADDVFKDVTSTYLTNADFEGEYSVHRYPRGENNKDRAIYLPSGWTINYENGKEWDMTILKSDDLAGNSFSSVPSLDNGGSQTYRIRFNNSYTNQRIELRQNVTLPKSSYKIEANWYISRTDAGDGYIKIGESRYNASTASSWQSFSQTFVSTGSETTILLGAYHSATTEKFYAFDNFKIYWNLTVSLQSLLDEANTFYTSEGTTYTILKAAIDAAEEVKSSTDADVLETQYTALSSALQFATEHRKPWLDAWTTANGNYNSGDYANVTGSEKSALKTELDKAEPTTADDYDNATTSLNSANTTFTSAKSSYDNLATINALITTAGTLTYADPDKKPSTVEATSASDAVTKTASQTTALRAYYESNGLAEGVDGASDFTSSISNPAATDGNNNWTCSGMNNSSNDEKPTASDGTTLNYFDGGNWGGNSWSASMTQSITIPAGRYLLTVCARGATSVATFTLSIGGETIDLPHSAASSGNVYGNGWTDASLEFTTKIKNVTIAINASSSTLHTWFSVTNFRLIQLEALDLADEDDYTALNSAVLAAESKVLGFENGEYAPYNNITALDALSAAKAMNQEEDNAKTYVNELTGILNNVSNWTANDGAVDIVYNSNMNIEDGWNPKGWSRVGNGWGQQITGLDTETQTSNGTAWYYNANSASQYGNAGSYYMPLPANTCYDLSVSYRSQGTSGNGLVSSLKASVLNESEEGLAETELGANNTQTFVRKTVRFKTGEAGNYILSLKNTGNFYFTDVTIERVSSGTISADLAAVKLEAQEYLDNAEYANIKGSERVALTSSKAKNPASELVADYYDLIVEIQEKQATFIAAKTNYDALATSISNAQSKVDASINIGDNAFQIPTSVKTTLQGAIDTANDEMEDAEMSSEGCVTVKSTLETAVTAFNNAYTTATLNVPSEVDAYSLYLADGGSYAKTVTFKDGNPSAGTYAIGMTEDAGSFYNQAIYFKATATANQYNLYIKDADGTKYYICTNKGGYNSGDNNQIRMTTDDTKALAIQVIALSSEDGAYNIKNMVANALLGTSDGGFYTVTSRNKFNISPATKNSVDVKLSAAKVGTTILPFEADIPEGVDAYTVSGIESELLTLTKVTTGKFAANTPYLIAGEESTNTLEGYGVAKTVSYTSGLLTGVYTATAAPVGSYVLQKNDELLAFYKVAEGKQPNVGAYRAYLTVPNNNARALFFSFDDDNKTTAVKTIEALTSGKSEIYNTSGVRQNALQKGMNILKMEDGSIRKVMIK